MILLIQEDELFDIDIQSHYHLVNVLIWWVSFHVYMFNCMDFNACWT